MFGEKLKKLRQSINMTQEELADRLNVSRPAVSKWETGKGYPSLESLKDIANLFGISIDELISDEDIKTKKKLDAGIRKKIIFTVAVILILAVGIWFMRTYIYGVPVSEYVTDIEIVETHTFKEPGKAADRATDYRITCEFWDSSQYVYGHHKIKETEKGYELIVYGAKSSVFRKDKSFSFDYYLDRSVLRINNIYRIYPEGTIAGDENWMRFEKLYMLRGTKMSDKERVAEIISLMEIDYYILPYEVEIYDNRIFFDFKECEEMWKFVSKMQRARSYLETIFVLVEDISNIKCTMYVGNEKYSWSQDKSYTDIDNKLVVLYEIADNPVVLEKIF